MGTTFYRAFTISQGLCLLLLQQSRRQQWHLSDANVVGRGRGEHLFCVNILQLHKNCQTLKVKVSKPLEQNGALNRRGCLVVVGEISQLLVQKQFSNILLIAKIIQVMFTNNLCMVFLITSIFHLYSSLSLFYLSSGTNVAILIDIALVTLNFKLYFHGGHFSTWAVSLSFLTPSTWGSRFWKSFISFGCTLWHSKCGWALTKRIQNMKTSFRH